MFNNNDKKKTEPMNSNKSGKNLPSVNMISEGTHLNGTIKTKNDVRVAGTLDGEAKADGKVIVSSTGKVDGNIEAVDADIAGNIDGEDAETGIHNIGRSVCQALDMAQQFLQMLFILPS